MPSAEPDCEFCEIIARESPDTREVYRTADVVAFFPLQPATLGHTLLIPRRHVPDIWALDADLAAELGRQTLRLAAAIRSAMNPQGLNIIQSNGAAATQTVHHLHIHVVPRWEGDAIGRIWPPESGYTEDQKDDAWAAVRREFNGQPAR